MIERIAMWCIIFSITFHNSNIASSFLNYFSWRKFSEWSSKPNKTDTVASFKSSVPPWRPSKKLFWAFLMMDEGVDGKFSNKYHDVSKSTKHPKTLTELKTNRKKLKQSKSFSHFTTFSYLLLQLIIFSCAFLLNSSPLQASAISGNDLIII